ncbi:MAG TPA: pyridoxamine 5'-phosphate oxidase [Geminicoccaceae bacterium]|nr:pyridoxamine 5'-phosphate oxidase [Geminicoccaceae bacterium]
MTTDIAAMRRDYEALGLAEADVLADPIAQFRRWFEDAERAGIYEPNAMTLATVGADGQPSARVVLLKAIDQRGLAFFTNLASRKSRELDANARAALVFWWGPLARQVRFEGVVERVADAEADAYFASRPRGSQIGAWASAQSSVIPDRRALEEAALSHEGRFGGGEVPRPEFWGGFRLVPARVEFWQGRGDRLHDRLRYVRGPAGNWRIERLAP